MTADEVLQFVEEEDVKFIKLAFCDAKGNQKNISIPSDRLPDVMRGGLPFDAEGIPGFGGIEKTDLVLFPIPSTMSILPWRPSSGRVARMFCDIRSGDGSPFADSREILKTAVMAAAKEGIACKIGAKFEFYLLINDEYGNETKVPYDRAGYMDVAPYDKGENVRRDMCLTLGEMGITPERSHHEAGPGQNQIDFKPNDALCAADDAITFKNVIKSIAAGYGLTACFHPKPFDGEAGSGLHIDMWLKPSDSGRDADFSAFMSGILSHIVDITVFLNPTEASYARMGEMKAPKYVSWSRENRSQLVRLPAQGEGYDHIELRSPDCKINPYLAYALLIYAGLDGLKKGLTVPESVDADLNGADKKITGKLKSLPLSLDEARLAAAKSGFVRSHIPAHILAAYGIK